MTKGIHVSILEGAEGIRRKGVVWCSWRKDGVCCEGVEGRWMLTVTLIVDGNESR